MAVKGSICQLLLSYDAALVPPGGSEVFASTAPPSKSYKKEPAGHAFHHFALLQSGLLKPEVEEEVKESPEDAAESTSGFSAQDDQIPEGVNWKGKRKKAKKLEGNDLYALLGLQNERWTATEAQIKQAYKKSALEHHPDKKGAATADEETKKAIEDHFKAIQDAYETLSDPAKRREFDSTDDFDDTLPYDCASEDFFKVFGPAFRRQSRWSVGKPVPELGEEGTPWEAVNAFYNFWFGFRSWREFPHPDEEDLEQAESREHRRWMERINSKLREKGKKDETRRLKEFVEVAYKLDPRVTQRKEEEKAERERRKREKAEAANARRREEEDKRAAEAQRLAAIAAEEAAKTEAARKARQVEKKEMQRARARIRKSCNDLPVLEAADDVETLCSKLDLAGLQAAGDALGAAGLTAEQRLEMLQHKVQDLELGEDGARAAREEAARQAAQQAEAEDRKKREERMREWTEEEMRMLEKALDKFPQGTVKRWEQVAGYVRSRDVQEVLEMVKHGLKSGKYAAARQGGSFSVKKKLQGNTVIESGPSRRVEAFTDVDVNLSGTAAAVFMGADAGGISPPAAPGTPTSQPTAKPAAAKKSASVSPAATPAEPAAAAPATAPAATSATPAVKPAVAATPAAKKKVPAAAPVLPEPSAGKPAAAVTAAATGGKKKAAAAGKPAAAAAKEAGPSPETAEPEAAAAAQNGTTAEGPAGPAAEGWDETQELALVRALKQFGKDVDDRWQKISEVVPGKSKAQCFKRFKELRDSFRAKKSGD